MYKILAQDYIATEYLDNAPFGSNGYGYGYGGTFAAQREVETKSFVIHREYEPFVFTSLDGVTWSMTALPFQPIQFRTIKDYDGSDLNIAFINGTYERYISNQISSSLSDWTLINTNEAEYGISAYRADENFIYNNNGTAFYRNEDLPPITNFRISNPLPLTLSTQIFKTSTGYIKPGFPGAENKLEYLYSEDDIVYSVFTINPYEFFPTSETYISGNIDVLFSDDSKLVATFVDSTYQKAYYVISTDGGKSWTNAFSKVWNRNASISQLSSVGNKYLIFPSVSSFQPPLSQLPYLWSEDLVNWNEQSIDLTALGLEGNFAFYDKGPISSGDTLIFSYSTTNYIPVSLATSDGISWSLGATFPNGQFSEFFISKTIILTDQDVIGGQGTGLFVELVEPKNIYTVPENSETIVSSIFISNNKTVSTTYDLAVVPSGETLSVKNHIRWESPLEGNSFDLIDSKITLSEGDSVYLIPSSVAPLAITLFGVEKNVI
jgi:hypothetical protein